MHKTIKSYLNTFISDHTLQHLSEAQKFEFYCNYFLISKCIPTSVDLHNITTPEGDKGIDGIATIINEDHIFDLDDIKTIFKADKRNNDIEIIITQCKTSESLKIGELQAFFAEVKRFIKNPTYKSDEICQINNSLFKVITENAAKIRPDGLKLFLKFSYTGRYQKPEDFEQAIEDFKNEINHENIFSSISCEIIDQTKLIELWKKSTTPTQANLKFNECIRLGEDISNVNQAYWIVANAQDFVRNVLTKNNKLNYSIFEENVRDFLGEQNEVNKKIKNTLKNETSKTRFSVLNNGITIVSPKVNIMSNNIYFEQYQIVNGCQTSNILFQNANLLDESVKVSIKIIETNNEDVFSNLVMATNSQTEIKSTQFYSLKPLLKRVEQYFETFTKPSDTRLYFERRENQFAEKTVPNNRIYERDIAVRAVASMFLEAPHNATRYPKKVYENYSNIIFADNVKEIVFYTACLTLYKIDRLISQKKVPSDFQKYKWHMLVLLKKLIIPSENDTSKLEANQIEKNCLKIIKVLQKNTDLENSFIKIVEAIQKCDEITRDMLKRERILSKMIENLDI